MPGIYIHIPFCKQACNYCDFYFSTHLSNKENVVEAIVKETEFRKDYLEKKDITSIYFGGGTPSLLLKGELDKILHALSRYFTWDNGCEITLEANPDDINQQSLINWKEAGVNRLSIGLQSFNNNELKWMNRAHTAEESFSSVKLAQDEGFENITIDLIYGSKFQTLQGWEKTLEKAIDLNTKHISSYNLTIESKTHLGADFKKGKEPPVDDELSSAQFLLMLEKLSSLGFIHYEISNFGKDGFFAKHNSNYWLQEPYLGLGPSAHSFNGKSRQWNVKNNNLYVKAVNAQNNFFEKEELTVKDKYNEYVLTRLRTIWGCDIKEIEKLFGNEIKEHFKNAIALKLNYMEEKNGIFTLNKTGKLSADGIASDLFVP